MLCLRCHAGSTCSRRVFFAHFVYSNNTHVICAPLQLGHSLTLIGHFVYTCTSVPHFFPNMILSYVAINNVTKLGGINQSLLVNTAKLFCDLKTAYQFTLCCRSSFLLLFSETNEIFYPPSHNLYSKKIFKERSLSFGKSSLPFVPPSFNLVVYAL